jgi:hypothetical protein
MAKLSKDWVTDGLIDFEYKKLQLLAYLQYTHKHFHELKIYPHLADLINHYQELNKLQRGKADLNRLFPKEIDSIDFEKLKINYKSSLSDDEVMNEIAMILDYSLPKLNSQIQEGKEIYDFVEDNVEFRPVGIIPIYNQEGYILLSTEYSSLIHAFKYQSDFLVYAGEKYRMVKMWLITVFQKTLINTLSKIKLDLVREFKELPNPATWHLHSKSDFPLEETLIPMSKRIILKSVNYI